MFAAQQRRTKSRGARSEPKSLCAIFDVEACSLGARKLSNRDIARRRDQFPELAISRKAVQEFTVGIDPNGTTRIVTLIVLNKEMTSTLKTVRIPCCRGKRGVAKRSLFLQRTKNLETGLLYLDLLTERPEKANAVKLEKPEPGQWKLAEDILDPDGGAVVGSRHRFYPDSGAVIAFIYCLGNGPSAEPVVEDIIYNGPSASWYNPRCRHSLDAPWLISEHNRKPVPLPYSMDEHLFVNEFTFSTLNEVIESRKRERKGGRGNSARKKRRKRPQSVSEAVSQPLRALRERKVRR